MTTPGEWNLTPEELQQFTQDHADWVTSCLKEGDSKDWSPNLWVKVATPSGLCIEVFTLYVPFNTSEEKRAAMVRCGRTLAKNGSAPLAVTFSSEVWMSKDPQPGVEPKDDPNRGEAIIVAGVAAKGAFYVSKAPIERVNGCIVPVTFTTPSDKGAPFNFLRHFFEGWATASMAMRRTAAVPSVN
jgi:hypothetical protein